MRFRGNKLHRLIGRHESIDDPKLLREVNDEFIRMVEDFKLDRVEMNPELAQDMDRASELNRNLGKLSLLDTYAVMDAAAFSGDKALGNVAIRTINARFPIEASAYPVPNDIGDDDKAVAKFTANRNAYFAANERTRAEWLKGLDIARESRGKVPFSHAVQQAGVLLDKEHPTTFNRRNYPVIVGSGENATTQSEKTLPPTFTLDNFDATILKSHEAARRIRAEDHEIERREEERRKIAESGDTDDAVKYDPFADDED